MQTPSSCKKHCTKGCLRSYAQCSLTSETITIVTARDQAPFISQSGNNPPVGFDVDLINHIVDLLKIKIKYVYAEFSQFISIVQNDLNTISISSQTDTVGRENFVDFALFFRTGTAFLVLSNYMEPINGLSDLCGKTVGVVATSIQEIDVQKQNTQCGGNSIILKSVQSVTDLIDLVRNGVADVALYDEALFVSIASQSNNQLKVVGVPYDVQPYGILCNKQNPALCCALVNAINYLIQEGTYENLLKAYAFSYKNNGICPSRVNLNNGPSCLSTCTPTNFFCQKKLNPK